MKGFYPWKEGGRGSLQQKHFSSLFSDLPSGRLPPVRAGVVELQPCTLPVLLLHPQEAVPGRNPALPGLVRRVRLHSLNPGTHPCWGQQGASHSPPWSLRVLLCHLLGKLQPQQILPSSAVTPNRDQGRVAALSSGHWLWDSCQESVPCEGDPSFLGSTDSMLGWRCFTALGQGFLLCGRPGASAGSHAESCPEEQELAGVR